MTAIPCFRRVHDSQHRARRFLLGAVLCLTAACDSNYLPPSPPRDIDVLRAFGEKPAVNSRREEQGPPLHLYVDSSQSMRGFVANPDSGFRTAVDFLLDRSATAGYPLEVFQFSDRVLPLGNVAASAVLLPSFYSGRETSFPDLLQHVTEESNSNAVSVIVSDLVQSGRTGDQRALVVAFQEIARRGKQVLLLAFRSSFSGTYWVESRRRGFATLNLNLDGGTADRSRPFYVILIANTRTSLLEVRRYLLPDITGYEEFDASSPGLAVQDTEFLPPDLGVPSLWNLYETPKPTSRGAGHQTVVSFMQIGATAAETSPVRLRLKLASSAQGSSAIRSPSDLMISTDLRTYNGRGWTPLRAGDLSPEILFQTSDLAVTYKAPQPNPSSWLVYRVRISPGSGNLRVPAWVSEWTTPDDSLEMWGNRTLKLDLFIEAMNRSIKEKVPFTDQFILFGRGES